VLYAQEDGRFEARGVPIGAFTLGLRDPFSSGFAAVNDLGLSENGERLDVGDIVLDESPVTAVAFSPPDGAAQISITAPIEVTFSDQLKNASGVVVAFAGGAVSSSAILLPDGYTVRLTGAWPDAEVMTVTATTGVTDIFGRHPAAASSSHFTTVDLSPPEVISTSPEDKAIEVSEDTLVEVVFDEPLAPETHLDQLITLSGPSGDVTGSTVLGAVDRAVLTPATPLEGDATYTVTVNGALDSSGNLQTVPFTATFATPDTGLPELALLQPPVGSWTNTSQPAISIELGDAVSGIAPASAVLELDGVEYTPIATPSRMTFTVPYALDDGLHDIAATIADRAGNPNTLEEVIRIDTTPPSVAELFGVSSGDVLAGEVEVSAAATDLLSGVQAIQVLGDDAPVLTLLAPDFQGILSVTGLDDGAHDLTARALDRAGNTGPESIPVDVIVDNRPLSLTITAPALNANVRDEVYVRAVVSEPVKHLIFSVGDESISDDTAPYETALSLTDLPEGPATITVTAVGLHDEQASATRDIRVDLTAPEPPDPQRVFAEPPDNGRSLVHGEPGAVEPRTVVTMTNPANGSTATAPVALDGTFASYLEASVGDEISLVATDEAGNSSASTTTVVRETTTLPPQAATLGYLGRIVDRMGPARFEADGDDDAVFTMAFSQGAGITRQLAFVDVEGPGVRSTRREVPTKLGVVDSELGAPFLNLSDGRVDAPLTEGVTLILFAPDNGFIQRDARYTATAVFTNGTRFVGTVTVSRVAEHETVGMAFSAYNTALPKWAGEPGDPGALLPTETVGPVFSVHNDPTLPAPDAGAPGPPLPEPSDTDTGDLGAETPGTDSSPDGDAWSFEDFDTGELDVDRWMEFSDSGLFVDDGMLNLMSGAVATRCRFAVVENGVRARARVNLSDAHQRVGFNIPPESSATEPSYYFETVGQTTDAGPEIIVRVVATAGNAAGERVEIFSEETSTVFGDFVEIAIERSADEIVFRVDDIEVARQTHTSSAATSFGCSNSGDRPLLVDWVRIATRLDGAAVCVEP
jgi:hypothetical protein